MIYTLKLLYKHIIETVQLIQKHALHYYEFLQNFKQICEYLLRKEKHFHSFNDILKVVQITFYMIKYYYYHLHQLTHCGIWCTFVSVRYYCLRQHRSSAIIHFVSIWSSFNFFSLLLEFVELFTIIYTLKVLYKHIIETVQLN